MGTQCEAVTGSKPKWVQGLVANLMETLLKNKIHKLE